MMARSQRVFADTLLLAYIVTRAKLSSACTAVAVGKHASATGYPIIAHSEDSGPMANDVRLVRVPRNQWPVGSRRPLYNWHAGYPRVVSKELATPDYEPHGEEALSVPLGYIPQVPETWAYWDTDYGVQNEWGLSIGETTCTAKTVGWPSNLPYGRNNAGIEDLTKLALERCKTVRCAVQTMGDVAVEHGFYSADSGDPKQPAYTGSSECLMLADATPGEAWIFNVMTGRGNASAIWAAQRVPDNHIAIAANSFTIRKMNLSDTHNFMYSAGITTLAEDMGWWSPKQETSADIFDFYGSYGYVPTERDYAPAMVEFWRNVLNYYSGRRMWRVFSLLSPEEGAKLDPNRGNLPDTKDPYPNSVPAPKHSITPQMVMDVYRDHYEGTEYDLTKGMAAGPFGNPNRAPAPVGLSGLWERAISMYRTTWSFVLEVKPRRRSITWFGWDAPHGTAYLPLFGAATESAPDSYHSRDGHITKFSKNVAYWPFNVVNQYQDLNFQLINADVLKKARQVESEAFDAVKAWESEVDRKEIALEVDGNEAALAFLTQRSNAFADKIVAEWWDFAFSLFAKFGRFVVSYNESANGETVVRYPEWWLRSPEVGFTSWSAQGPYHGIPLDETWLRRSASLSNDLTSQTQMVSSSWLLFFVCIGATTAGLSYRAGIQQGKRSLDTDQRYFAVDP